MGELAGSGIVGVTEAYRLRQGLDVCPVARQKMPALRGSASAIKSGIKFVLYVREDGPFGRINAHRHNREILADLKRQFLGGAQKPVENFRAQHRALIVDERQNHGFLPEELPQGHRLAVLIAKSEIERDGTAEFLIQSDVAQQRRLYTRGLNRP